MPRVSSYTPSWLSRPSAGFDLFALPAGAKPASGASAAVHGPRKTIAQRGTELFVAVENEIRWTDLVWLKESSPDAQNDLYNRNGQQAEPAYRTLKISVPSRIRQLHISPQGDFLVVLTTTNTAHVVLLPSSDRFTTTDASALRPKVWQLGPTLHVRERSPIATCLWHPLGQEGHALVTITEDAILRLWELSTNDRKSFEDPALSFDLKKLANATSVEENLKASKFGAGLEFTPDIFEMEVASACFGGSGFSGEAPWAAMTLWIAMKTGDIYALSPLLPSRWQPASGQLADLGVQVRAKQMELDQGGTASELERSMAQAQSKWIEDLEDQEPVVPTAQSMFETVELYKRPSKPSAVPRLQGPFNVSPEADTDFELTDIFVTGFKGNDLEDLAADNDSDDFEAINEDQLMPGAVICLLTSNARVLLCLDMDGVEGQWLPTKSSRRQSVFDIELPTQDLLLLDTLSLTDNSDTQFCTPALTPDIRSRPAFFITHDQGISYVSLEELHRLLREELSFNEADTNPETQSGVGFRTNLLIQSSKVAAEEILNFSGNEADAKVMPNPATALVLEDSDIGYFLLTAANHQPFACTMDLPLGDLTFGLDNLAIDEGGAVADQLAIEFPPLDDPQPPYQPPDAFYRESSYPKFLGSQIPDRHRHILRDQVKLSPAAFDMFYQSHKIIGQETGELQKGVAELFRRVERMQDEWRDVVRRAAELNARVDAVIGDDDLDDEADDDEEDADNFFGGTKERIDNRVDAVQQRQQELVEQYERIQSKMRRARGKELSDKERAWGTEVTTTLQELGDGTDEGDSDGIQAKSKLKQRFSEVQDLKDELVRQAKEILEKQSNEGAASAFKVPEGLRKKGIERVMELLERETALVEAVGERVERLTAGMAT